MHRVGLKYRRRRYTGQIAGRVSCTSVQDNEFVHTVVGSASNTKPVRRCCCCCCKQPRDSIYRNFMSSMQFSAGELVIDTLLRSLSGPIVACFDVKRMKHDRQHRDGLRRLRVATSRDWCSSACCHSERLVFICAFPGVDVDCGNAKIVFRMTSLVRLSFVCFQCLVTFITVS